MRLTPGEPRIAFDGTDVPGAPRVLLVMGMGMPGAVWRPQIDGLGADHALAWFDHRGIGASAAPARAFGVADLAGDAARVADALGWDRFHLVGVSLGGMVAQELALSAPARVRSLTLIATHAGGPGGWVPTLRGLYHFAHALLGPQRRRVRHLTRLLYPPGFLRSVDRAVLRDRMQLQVGTRPPRRTALYQLGAVLRHDTRGRLAALRVPTLVVRPDADLLVRPRHSDHLHRAIPGARLVRVADGGHGVIFHAAAEVNAAIRAHVAAHEAG